MNSIKKYDAAKNYQTKPDENSQIILGLSDADDEDVIEESGTLDVERSMLSRMRDEQDPRYEQFNKDLSAFNDTVSEISRLEVNLIERHLDAGKYLSALRDWYIDAFGKSHGWVQFVLSEINYEYSAATGYRDIQLWTRLGPYRDLLIEGGNHRLKISALYLLANPQKVSDTAVAWVLDSLRFSLSMGQETEVVQEAVRDITAKKVQQIADAVRYIEKYVVKSKQKKVLEIIRRNSITSLPVVAAIADSPQDKIDELHATNHIEYIIERDGYFEHKSIPLDEAGQSDFEQSLYVENRERDLRQKQHIADSMAKREAEEQGTESEKHSVVEIPVVPKDARDDIIRFLNNNHHVKSAVGELLESVFIAQGDAGARSVLYTKRNIKDEKNG